MRHIQLGGDGACIVNILTGAARAFAANGFAMIIKLQSNADRVIAGTFDQCGGDRAVDPARHGNHHALRRAVSVSRFRGTDTEVNYRHFSQRRGVQNITHGAFTIASKARSQPLRPISYRLTGAHTRSRKVDLFVSTVSWPWGRGYSVDIPEQKCSA